MKKPPRGRSRTPSRASYGGKEYYIIILLCLLVLLTAVDLYLDHFKPAPETKQKPIALQQQTTEESKPVEVKEEPLQEREIPEETASVVQKSISLADVKVQVLNGCGVRGIASRVKGVLRDRGFDVMSYGNARSQNYSASQLIIRKNGTNSEHAAKLLAESLGIEADNISKDVNSSLVDIMVTLVIGRDHKQLNLETE
ncbi:hypothetical protein CEE37_11125 [candidate division LCP-89 bacterium B3_LCP]|uniref:LytR/CpsA/Psr regulator C-terminal domain-containing protein n=1 Tax=candidate division LCP-89 bacterium B3_LCP TaxID=2012998 RepID=A0A532UY08_UNCL8|nr:MAG: hypothetical protein CEE37_11125 [candidate division LCP-89 bacterium B3_LCP]